MKEMSNLFFDKYKKGIITIEAQSLIPEKFINLLWRNDVKIKNIKRVNMTTVLLDISLMDYGKIEELAAKASTKVKIVNRKGIAFFIIKLRKRVTLVIGGILFLGMLYYFSTYIWKIDIKTEKNISPYEIRQELYSYGIKPGIRKNKFDVYGIENSLIKNNEEIMWARVRIEGAKLKVSIVERQSPPKVIEDNTPCNLVAKRDAEVVRVFTTGGTAVVKKGEFVKKGQIVIKGQQGKEGSQYPIHAQGSVIGKTFYEDSKEIKMTGIKEERTGNFAENIYINVMKKKIYLKKSINKFDKYDKIEESKGFFNKELIYEKKGVPYTIDIKKSVDDIAEELTSRIKSGFDKNIKAENRIVDYKINGDTCTVKVLIVAEEDIAIKE